MKSMSSYEMKSWSSILGGTRGYLRPMAQGENVVDNMEKRDNNQLTLRAFSMHAVKTSTEDNERMNNACKVRMLEAASAEK